MVEQGEGGRIVNFASVAAFRSAINGAHTRKQGRHRRLHPQHGPRSGAISDHRQRHRAGLTDTAQPRYGMTEEEIGVDETIRSAGSQPEDMLPTVLFLCGPGGAYIAGQTHHVNSGGWMP